MVDSSIIDSDEPAPASCLASLLGIKGSLRFRPHGSTQKAHIILRRVTVSNDTSGDGETSSIMRFALFAHKRIEVKPGKELLLTVASDDGTLKDLPIMLEGDLRTADDSADARDDTKVADAEEVFVAPTAMPPKMRKAWSRKTDNTSHVMSLPARPPVTHSSIGIQVEPSYASTSTQVQPSRPYTSSQTRASVQVDPPHAIRTSTAVQTTYIDGVPLGPKVNDEAGVLLSNDIADYLSQRSLSPMDLDSPLASPVLSARESSAFSPTLVPDLIAKLELPLSQPSLASPTLSIASSNGANDMQMSPIDSNSPSHVSVSSTDTILPPSAPSSKKESSTLRHAESEPILASSGNALLISTTPNPKVTSKHAKQEIRNPFISAGFMTEFVGADKLSPHEKVVKTVPGSKIERITSKPSSSPSNPSETKLEASSPLPQVTTDVNLSRENTSQSLQITQSGVSLPSSASKPRTTKINTQAATPSSASTNSKSPRKAKVPIPPTFPQNAVAPSPAPSADSKPLSARLNVPQSSQNAVVLSSAVSSDSKPPQRTESPSIAKLEVASPPSASPAFKSPQAKLKTLPATTQNAVASSSKVVLEKSIPTQPLHHLRLMSAHIQEKSPATVTTLPASCADRTSPPPGPQAIAYIPSGRSSNPLNIRPSANLARKAIPTAPKSLTQTPTSAKKRVVVGAGWPLVKATNGTGPSATIPPPPTLPPLTLPPPPTPAAPPLECPTPTPGLPPINLSHIVSYSSPSPPPSAPPPLPDPPAPALAPASSNPPANKWKRVTGDVPVIPASIDTSIPAALPFNSIAEDKIVQVVMKGPNPLEKTLRDGTAQVASPSTTQATPLSLTASSNGRDLRNRTSDAATQPKVEVSSPVISRRDLSELTTSSTPTAARSPGTCHSLWLANFSEDATDIVIPLSTPALPATTPTATPTVSSLAHPLPAKPSLPLGQSTSSSRGVKRERPEHSPERDRDSSKRKKKRTFMWPTVGSNHSVRLVGDGELGIQRIALNSSGSHFALCCESRIFIVKLRRKSE
ncbi:hypothetical protein DXG03_006626 [Asterophora parasitica]|uniref:Uncharacterized protein n=1 Tax=Asterophora parasitica TaxID=117018 RepID=A0A9P7KAJ0_9AGAR|nr:hypothetical protein DXG03_006626 [Asterophora parasitica]